MQIASISIYALELPLAKPYVMSRGRIFELLHSTVVKIETDTGLTGWGEVCPWGTNYLPAFAGALRAAVVELAPHLIGQDPRRVEVLTRLMDSMLTGHNYAKAAVDYACWDILGKATGRPIYELLGGGFDDNPVALVSTQMVDTPDNMEGNLEYWRARGYRRHSIKLGGGVDSDIERLRRLAKLRRPNEEFIFDANGGWSPWEAIRVLNATADLEYWIEQPCLTYEQCAAVKTSTRQAMSLDECVFEVRDLLRAINDQTISLLNIKVARLGGLTRSRWIRDVCMAHDIPILAMCMAGTVLNDTVVAHFAQSMPGSRCLGAWSCQEMLTVDLAPGQGARNINGNFAPPQLPGIGVEPDVNLLGAPLAEIH